MKTKEVIGLVLIIQFMLFLITLFFNGFYMMYFNINHIPLNSLQQSIKILIDSYFDLSMIFGLIGYFCFKSYRRTVKCRWYRMHK